MYKIPKISNEVCASISSEVGLTLMNKDYKSGPELTVKDENGYLDYGVSYKDKRYKDILKELKGNVLVMGLGFGCNVIRACQKKTVKRVDVLETDRRVIKLFWKLHGVFDGWEKLNIIVADAKTKDLSNNDYDHLFIDIFHYYNKEYVSQIRKIKDTYKGVETHCINLK